VLQLSVVRSGSDGDRPGYGPHSLFRGSSMPEDMAVLIAQAVEKAVQPLRDEIASLKDQQTLDRAEFERFKVTHRQFAVQMGKDLDDLFEANSKATLKPQPMQKDRADILRALLVANSGKMLAKDARKKMHLSKERFSNLLLICDFIERKPYHLDRRQDVIILKSELVRPNC
jgi:hypothetical protein